MMALLRLRLLFHDDGCGELLDQTGLCPHCGFHPDMQSLGSRDVPVADLLANRSYLATGREPVPAGSL